MIKQWQTIASKAMGNFKIFTIRQDTKISPRTGKQHNFFVIESTDWVNIFPVTADGKVVMVRQCRHGNGEITLEVPGGMVDEGEEPIVSAVRELREETGYAGENARPIGSVAPNPALFDNKCYSFMVDNVTQVGEQSFDGSEDIEIELVPVTDFPELIASGKISHALTINAYYFYQQQR